MTAADIAKRLKSIIDYVRDCQVRVAKGEIMDLAGLDKNVIEICDAVAALPKTEAQELEKQMSTLIENLEVLGNAMREQHARSEGTDPADFDEEE